MFFRLILQQFVCLYKLGKITNMEHLVMWKTEGFPTLGTYSQTKTENLRARPDTL